MPSCRQQPCPLLPALLPGLLALVFTLPVQGQALINQAGPAPLISGQSIGTVLPVEQAFALQAFAMADGSITLQWQISPGHYLYRKSLQILAADDSMLALPVLPAGVQIEDEFFGAVEVYYEQLTLALPPALLPERSGSAAQWFEFSVEFQGCAQDTYCYPPHRQALSLELP